MGERKTFPVPAVARTISGRRKEAARDWMAPDAGPREVQLRFVTELSFDEYRKQRGWEAATSSRCPLCEAGSCHFHRLGTYMRKVPAVAWVARYYCPESHTTFGLLPDFYASRMPGTLDMIEEAATKAESAPSVEMVADALRPADAPDAVTLGAAPRSSGSGCGCSSRARSSRRSRG